MKTICGLTTVLVSLVLAGLGATAAAADSFDPYDFDVRLDGGPGAEAGKPSCVPDGAGGQVCTASMELVTTGMSQKGDGPPEEQQPLRLDRDGLRLERHRLRRAHRRRQLVG